MPSYLRQCRRWLKRERDLLSHNWALTRSKAKQSFPHHRRKRVANQPTISPLFQIRLSSPPLIHQPAETFSPGISPTNLATRWEGGEAHTDFCYYYIPFSTTHSSASIYSSYNPYVHSGELQVRGLSPTSSRVEQILICPTS